MLSEVEMVFKGSIRDFIQNPVLSDKAFAESEARFVPTYTVKIVEQDRIVATSDKPWSLYEIVSRFRDDEPKKYVGLRAYRYLREGNGTEKDNDFWSSLNNLISLNVLDNSYSPLNFNKDVECYRRGILTRAYSPLYEHTKPF